MKTEISIEQNLLRLAAFTLGIFLMTQAGANNGEENKTKATSNTTETKTVEATNAETTSTAVLAENVEVLSVDLEIDVEAWMLNASDSLWNSNSAIKNDPDILLESWMTDLDKW